MHCILHIGTRKTGSSSIQGYLKKNAKALEHQGILVPSNASENGFQFSVSADPLMSLWFYLARENIKTEDDLKKMQTRTRHYLDQDIARVNPKTVILSSEDFSFFTDERQTRFAKEYFNQFSSFSVVVYLRRQDRYVVSDISTGLLNGGQKSFTLRDDPAALEHLNYKKLIDAWANVFGKEAMKIRIFEPAHMTGGDLLTDFCSMTGIDTHGLEDPDFANPSVTAVAQSFLRIANQKIPSIDDQGNFNHSRGPLNMVLIKHFNGRPPLPARGDAEKFYAYFRQSNEALRQEYLPNHPQPIFTEDFSTYPDISEEQQLGFEDGANLAVTLWEDSQLEIGRLKRKIAQLEGPKKSKII